MPDGTKVAIKVTAIPDSADNVAQREEAVATDVALGGYLASHGGSVPYRVLHRASRTTYCVIKKKWCRCDSRACHKYVCRVCKAPVRFQSVSLLALLDSSYIGGVRETFHQGCQ
jgi:hypothetical protein